MHDAFFNWGNALTHEAKALYKTDLDTSRSLWKQARDKYQLALNIKPDDHEAAINWAASLANEANALPSIELNNARALWKQARDKYQQILSIKPDNHVVANLYGNALIDEARAIAMSNSEQSQQLLNQAEQLFVAHATTAPAVVAYNLACVYGLRGATQNCLTWLQISREHKTLPDCAHLRDDKDLDAVRNTPEFIEWFKQVCP
jgi:hypothetical protein